MKGNLVYTIEDGKKLRRVFLTVGCDEEFVPCSISETRRRRIVRFLRESVEQGVLLTYSDLSLILLSSISTLKRDINILEKQGYSISLKGRRKRC